MECQAPGCERGPATGHALIRTSPKGQQFEGMCREHHSNPGDDFIEALIEGRNLAQRGQVPQ